MLNPRLAHRYAKALLDIAVEQKKLEEVFADVQWLQAVCKSNRDFVNLMRSPIVKADKKQKIVEAIAGKSLGKITLGFIRLLISKARESHLPEMLSSFVGLYKEYKNIVSAKLTTAVPASDAVKKSIINQIKKVGGVQNIELEEQVDEAVIGGFVLEVGDKMIDASIAYDLREIAKQFRNNDFIYSVR